MSTFTILRSRPTGHTSRTFAQRLGSSCTYSGMMERSDGVWRPGSSRTFYGRPIAATSRSPQTAASTSREGVEQATSTLSAEMAPCAAYCTDRPTSVVVRRSSSNTGVDAAISSTSCATADARRSTAWTRMDAQLRWQAPMPVGRSVKRRGHATVPGSLTCADASLRARTPSVTSRS
jgi:hypothetical protein